VSRGSKSAATPRHLMPRLGRASVSILWPRSCHICIRGDFMVGVWVEVGVRLELELTWMFDLGFSL